VGGGGGVRMCAYVCVCVCCFPGRGEHRAEDRTHTARSANTTEKMDSQPAEQARTSDVTPTQEDWIRDQNIVDLNGNQGVSG
jgi:hypothetical protein